jgi:hypothetical protein
MAAFHQWRRDVIAEAERQGFEVDRARVRSRAAVAEIEALLARGQARAEARAALRAAELAAMREQVRALLAAEVGEARAAAVAPLVSARLEAEGLRSPFELFRWAAAGRPAGAPMYARLYALLPSRVVADPPRVTWLTERDRPQSDNERAQIVAALGPDTPYCLYRRWSTAPHDGAQAQGPDMIAGAPHDDYDFDEMWDRSGIPIDGDKVRARPGRLLTAGRLEYLDARTWEGAPGYVRAVLYALVPSEGAVATPESAAWLNMHEGGNCVVNLVREALRGRPAPGPRRVAYEATLDQFAARFAETGVGHKELAEMCRVLRVRIVTCDIDGNVLWEPRNKQGAPVAGHHQTIKIYRQGAHAYGTPPKIPTPTAAAEYPCPKREDGKPLDPEVLRAAQLDFLRARRAAGALDRAWCLGAEVVDESGTVWRPAGYSLQLVDTLAAHYGVDARDFATAHEVAAAFDQPLAAERLSADGLPLRLGGASAFRFQQWLARNGIGRLSAPHAALWREASVEARVWNSAAPVAGTRLIDMSAAYLGCGATGQGVAKAWADRFGFPEAAQHEFAVAGLAEVRDQAGAVRVARWALAADAPDAIAKTVAAHLAESDWMPIPLAAYLADTGLAALEVDRALVSFGRLAGLRFPGRDHAVACVGSCSRRRRRHSLITADPAEAAHYVRQHDAADAARPEGEPRANAIVRERGGLFEVEWHAGDLSDRSHIRAYVLAYCHIAVFDAIRQFAPGDLAYVCVDGLRLAPGVAVPPGVPMAEARDGAWHWAGGRMPVHDADSAKRPPPGLWRAKDEGARYAWLAAHAAVGAREGAARGAAEARPPLLDAELATSPFTFLDGQGGSGKSYRVARAFEGRRLTMLFPTLELMRAMADSREVNPHAFPCDTFHRFFHVGDADRWAPETMGRARPDVVFIDEVGMIPLPLLQKVVAWLRGVRAQVVLAGDPTGQLQSIDGGAGNGAAMLEWLRAEARVVEMRTDFRAAGCPALQELKRAMWRQPDALGAFRAAVAGGAVASMTVAQAGEAWRPGDLFLAATRAARGAMGALVAARLAAAGAPVALRFAPADHLRAQYRRKKSGALATAPHPATGAPTPVHAGTRVEVPAGTAWSPDLWEPAAASTVHSAQGQTVRAPHRVFIIDAALGADWFAGGAYVAVSRAQNIGQVVRVAL